MDKYKSELQGLKWVKVEGMKFCIRKLNPLLDFTLDKMPTIFTDFNTKRKTEQTNIPLVTQKKYLDDMKAIIQAGVIEPVLVQVGVGEKEGKENGLTVNDILRDTSLASKLYIEIIANSLNRFKGLKGLFFSIQIRGMLYTEWRKNMANFQ